MLKGIQGSASSYDGYFTGFDELWLFDSRPREALPGGIVITSEGPIAQRAVSGLDRWLDRTGCRLGLGDGHGLNFATLDESIERRLRSVATDSRLVDPPREFTRLERKILDRLLEPPFQGRDALREQLAAGRVTAGFAGDTRTIRIRRGDPAPEADVSGRIPVEAQAVDVDGGHWL